MKLITIIPLIFLSFNWLIISFVAAKFTHNIVSLDDLSLLNPPEFTSIEVKASVFSIIIYYRLDIIYDFIYYVCCVMYYISYMYINILLPAWKEHAKNRILSIPA